MRRFSRPGFAAATLLILILGSPRAPAAPSFGASSTPAPTAILPPSTPIVSAAEICPGPGSPSVEFVPDRVPDLFEQQILDFLNAGGSSERLATSIRALAIPFRHPEQEFLEVRFNLVHQDVTGDGIPEIVLSLGFAGFYQGDYVDYRPHGLVLSCREGSYRRIGLFPFVELFQTGDLTGDGLPELVFMKELSTLDAVVSFFTWAADSFVQLAVNPSHDFAYRIGIWIDRELHVPLDGPNLQDVDRDGNLELVFARLVYRTSDSREARSGPLRDRREVWGWNETAIELERWDYDPPEFRFQAVQDGDDLTLFGDLGEALASYRRALSEDRLKSFQLFHTPDSVLLRYGAPIPTPDPAERARLNAYVQYRIMLVHALLGNEGEAERAFRLLLESQSGSDPGFPYAEMGQAFWNAYLQEGELSSACKAAVDYALRHANEVLIPLGSSTYGYWNREYRPEDICPFEDGGG